MPDNRSDPRPEPRSKRWFVALSVVAAILLALGVAVTLTVAGRRVPQASEPAGEPLTPQEVAEIKAAVEKQTGMPVRHVCGRPCERLKTCSGGNRLADGRAVSFCSYISGDNRPDTPAGFTRLTQLS